MILEDVRLFLGLDEEQTSKDNLLSLIIKNTSTRLKSILGGVETIPPELEYIVVEVTIKRFNRIGSEGLTEHGVEGENVKFIGNDDFEEYQSDIGRFLNKDVGNKKGGFKFI